jgi:hypothetical protein
VIFGGAARVIDAWLGLKGRLRTAWRALPGDLLGLLVMRGCGISGPGRVVRHDGVSAVVVEDPRVAWYLDRGLMPIYAQTLGRYVFAREPLPDATVAHEMEHVRQWQRLGPIFLPAYFASSAAALLRRKHPYDNNRFEIAARLRETAARSREVS